MSSLPLFFLGEEPKWIPHPNFKQWSPTIKYTFRRRDLLRFLITLHSAKELRIETRRAGHPAPTNRPSFLILKDSAMTRAGDNVPVKKTSLGKTKTKSNEVTAKKDRDV